MESLYVLVKVEMGCLEDVFGRVSKLTGVVDANVVTGSYDIVVKIQGEHVADALGMVVKDLRKIKGIKTTETLICVSL